MKNKSLYIYMQFIHLGQGSSNIPPPHFSIEAKPQFEPQLNCTSLEQAFAIENDSWLLKLKRNDRFKYTVFYEMLSNVACLRGQCLRQTMHGNNPIRRQALENFLNACRFAIVKNGLFLPLHVIKS